MTQGISGRRLPEHPAYIVISPATSVLRGDDWQKTCAYPLPPRVSLANYRFKINTIRQSLFSNNAGMIQKSWKKEMNYNQQSARPLSNAIFLRRVVKLRLIDESLLRRVNWPYTSEMLARNLESPTCFHPNDWKSTDTSNFTSQLLFQFISFPVFVESEKPGSCWESIIA